MAWIFSSVTKDILFVTAVIFLALYFYFSHVYSYWKKRGVYYIKPMLCFGNAGNMILRKESFADLLKRGYREAVGHKVFGIFVLDRPMLVIRDLDVIRSVLVKDVSAFPGKFFLLPENFDPLFARSLLSSTGKRWKYLRIKLTPTFTSGKIKMMSPLVEETSKELLTHIDQEVSEGKSIALRHLTYKFTADNLASCIFGMNMNALKDHTGDIVATVTKMFRPNILQIIVGVIQLLIPCLQRFLSAKFFDTGVNDFVRKTFWDVANHRKENGIVRKDLVDLLMQLREEGEIRAEDAKDLDEIKQDSKYVDMAYSKTDDISIKLEDDDIIAQAYLLVVAGFETSSTALSYVLFELAGNQDVQDKLRREIEDVLETHDNKISYDAIADMSYLEMVVAEALRKNPPLYFFERECVSDYKIEGTDITIEKGTLVIIPTIGIHYDPDIYPEPEKFDTERFSTKNKHTRSIFANLTFGVGPRKCLGMRFALLQVKTAIVHILKTYQVRPCKETPASPLQVEPYSPTNSPKKDIVLTFTKLK